MQFFIFIVEAQRILFKDAASRTNTIKQMQFFIFIVEAQRILFKDTASRTNTIKQMQFIILLLRRSVSSLL